MNVNGKTLFKILMFTPGLNNRWGIPLLYEDDPGVGKTSIIRSWSYEFGLGFYDMIAMLYQPPDFGGYPVPVTDDAGRMRINSVPLSIFMDLPDNCVLMFDELSLVPPAVQKALMRVVLEGRVGDHVLPKGVRIVAAQNDPRDCAGHPLLAPLANRFSHHQFPRVPSYSTAGASWCEWLLSPTAFEEPQPSTVCTELEQQVQKGWVNAFAKARGAVVEFIRNRGDLLDVKPEHQDPTASKAWPSRRTWEMATRVMATAEILGANPIEEHMLVASLIGDSASKEFAEFRAKLDLPNPVDLLDEKISWNFNEKRPDIAYAVLNAMRAILEPKDCENRLARCTAFFRIIDAVREGGSPDIAMTCASTLMSIPESMTPEINKQILPKLLPTASAMRGVL